LPTPESLKGKSIGVAQGTIQEAYAQALWQSKGINVVSYQNQDLVNQDLQSGRVDATLTNAAAAQSGFLDTAAGKDFAFSGEMLNDPKYLGAGTAIGLRKGDKEHVDMINKALVAIHQNGTFEKIEKKYFSFEVYNKKS